MPLTTNRRIVVLGRPDLRGFAVAAATHVYKDGFVGAHPITGYAKPFEPGDIFLGLADQEADNSDGAAGDTTFIGGKRGMVDVRIAGDFEHALSGVGNGDIGRAVYATADDTLSLAGHPDAFVGRVMAKTATAKAVISLKQFGQKPSVSDFGSLEVLYDGSMMVTPTGEVAGPTYLERLELDSVLGEGIFKDVNLLVFGFDPVAEIAQASIATVQRFSVAKGITFAMRMNVDEIGDSAALDVDWGLTLQFDDTIKADMDDASLTKHVRFHLDGGNTNILAESDDAVTDVAALDTGTDNSQAGAKNFFILVRPSGIAELYIGTTLANRARVLANTGFKVGTIGAFSGFVNMEKTVNDTMGIVLIEEMRVAGSPN